MERVLDKIIQADRMANDILTKAQEEKQAIERETAYQKAEISEKLRLDIAAALDDIAAQRKLEEERRRAELRVSFEQKKAAMQSRYDEYEALWAKKALANILSE